DNTYVYVCIMGVFPPSFLHVYVSFFSLLLPLFNSTFLILHFLHRSSSPGNKKEEDMKKKITKTTFTHFRCFSMPSETE
ncbi:hypothetical protein VIGAN_09169800, partial [Vigna angularis var. angularis]